MAVPYAVHQCPGPKEISKIGRLPEEKSGMVQRLNSTASKSPKILHDLPPIGLPVIESAISVQDFLLNPATSWA